MSREGLTTKQRLFIESYLSNGFNATEAARQAGYKGREHTLHVVGYENLRKPEIAVVVQERINEAAMSANEVLARLSKQARGSLAQVLTEDGEFDLKDAKARGVDDLLKKLKVRKSTRKVRGSDDEEIEEVTHEYEIHDSQAALVHLGKYHRLFADLQEVNHGGKIEVEYTNDWRGAGDTSVSPSRPADSQTTGEKV